MKKIDTASFDKQDMSAEDASERYRETIELQILHHISKLPGTLMQKESMEKLKELKQSHPVDKFYIRPSIIQINIF
jgi:hypothetical protein